MIKPRRLLIGSLLVLGVTVPLAAGLLLWDDQPEQRLPSGAVMRLTTIQYGTPRPIVYGPVWKRRLFPLAPYLPFDLSRRISWNVRDPSNLALPSALMVGLAYDRPTSQHPRGDLVDSHGCRYGPLVNLLGAGDGPNSWLEVFPFLPRRQASFQLETYLRDEGARVPTGTFTLVNPAGTRHPAWEAERLPATQRSGPLEVTLLAAERGWSPSRQQLATADEVPFTKLGYRLADRSQGWAPVGAALHDATGGSYRFDFNDWRRRPGVVFVRGDNLCREEPAYEYEVQFSRAGTPGARPDQTYDLGMVAPRNGRPSFIRVPDGKQVAVYLKNWGVRSTLSAMWEPGEGRVGQLWVTGPDGVPRSPARLPVPRGRPFIQGFQVQLPKGTRQVRLRLGTYQTRTVKFRIKPRWLAPGSETPTSTPP